MDPIKLNPDVYSAVKKFSQNKVIGEQERDALAMIMFQDSRIDAQEQSVLDQLENQVAFTITDGKRQTTLDPAEIQFPAKTAAQQIAADSQSPERSRLYQEITAIDPEVKPEEIARTFALLDRTGVSPADAAELIHNQHQHLHRDPQLSRPRDVLAALQAYGIIQESVQQLKELPEPNQRYLQDVAQSLKAGDYHIFAGRDLALSPGTLAATFPTEDFIITPDFKLEDPFQRATMLHELIHASHDVEFEGKQALGVTSGFSEMEAHLAEGLYLLHARETDAYYPPVTGGDRQVMDYADSYRQHIRTQRAAEAQPGPERERQARAAYEAFSQQEDLFRVELMTHRGYTPSFGRLKFADGIQPKPADP